MVSYLDDASFVFRSFCPDYANIKGENNELVKVDPFEVNVGDEIVVLPGKKVPQDMARVVFDGSKFFSMCLQ